MTWTPERHAEYTRTIAMIRRSAERQDVGGGLSPDAVIASSAAYAASVAFQDAFVNFVAKRIVDEFIKFAGALSTPRALYYERRRLIRLLTRRAGEPRRANFT